MSARPINLLICNIIKRQSKAIGSKVAPFRTFPTMSTPPTRMFNMNSNYYALKNTNRFYTSSSNAGKEQQKIANMISSPELLKAAVKVEQKPPSKLKTLTQKYGAAGILVYLAVGCVDLGVTLGVIQLVGLEKVKALEESVLDVVYSTGEKFGIKKKQESALVEDPATVTSNANSELVPLEKDAPSFASVFILAYGIHKTLLLPVRLGITAAITPAIVRKLHQLGWARYFPRLFAASAPKKP